MASFFGALREKTINRVVEISVNDIVPNPHQPRRYFENSELQQLAESIKQDGILQPLTVRKTEDGYELVSGERRLRASKLIGLAVVPCIIIAVTERNSALLALVENVQREDLTFFDEALAISQLIEFYGMTQEDAAIRLGMAQSTVANKIRLLKLSNPERDAISAAGLTERHARAMLKLKDKDVEFRVTVIDKIKRFNMNVDRTENYIEEILKADTEKESYRKRAVVLRDVKLFMNTINKAVQTMQMAGVPANAKKTQNDEFIEYHIRIPVEKNARI